MAFERSSVRRHTQSRKWTQTRETFIQKHRKVMVLSRVLWVGSGDMKGVFKNAYFRAGNEVIALDLDRPDAADVSAATTYAQ